MGGVRSGRGVLLMALLGCLAICTARAQENPDIEHARRIITLLNEGKFDQLAQQFDAQMAAALPAAQLGVVWQTLGQQVGAFVSFVDQAVRTPVPGVTTVILGCQFDKAALNAVISFDAAKKIAGLRFTPRQAAEPTRSVPPSSSRFTEESVTVGAGEWALPGTLSLPTGPIAGAVVLVHGSGPSDRDETIGANKPFRDLAWGLADRGMAVLRYDKRTYRYAARMAAMKNFTVRDETIDDAALAAGLLRSHARIDPKRVFVLGHSLGGMLAPRIAVQDPSLAGLVIMAGNTRPILEAAREQLAYLASLTPGARVPDGALDALRRRAPASYWRDLDGYKPAQVAATLAMPILILQGERDYQVTMEDLQGWRAALTGHPGVTIKTYPTLNHLFLPGHGPGTPAEYDQPGHIPDLVLDDIARWITKV